MPAGDVVHHPARPAPRGAAVVDRGEAVGLAAVQHQHQPARGGPRRRGGSGTGQASGAILSWQHGRSSRSGRRCSHRTARRMGAAGASSAVGAARQDGAMATETPETSGDVAGRGRAAARPARSTATCPSRSRTPAGATTSSTTRRSPTPTSTSGCAGSRSSRSSSPSCARPTRPTQKVGGAVSTEFTAVDHLEPMMSLDNAFSFEELETWRGRLARDGVEDAGDALRAQGRRAGDQPALRGRPAGPGRHPRRRPHRRGRHPQRAHHRQRARTGSPAPTTTRCPRGSRSAARCSCRSRRSSGSTSR